VTESEGNGGGEENEKRRRERGHVEWTASCRVLLKLGRGKMRSG